MHNWLVGLVFEVAVPSGPELVAWPAVHLSQLLLGWADLHTSFNAVGGQRSSAVGIPLLEHRLLNLGITSDKVIKGLDIGLSTEHGEGEVMVLEVETDTGKVDKRLDASAAELLWVTDTRALKDKGRAEGTARDDNLLACPVGLVLQLAGGKRLAWNGSDCNGTVALKDNLAKYELC